MNSALKSRRRLILLTLFAVSANCSTTDHSKDSSRVRPKPAQSIPNGVLRAWTSTTDSSHDGVVVSTGPVSDSVTAMSLVEELRVDDESDSRGAFGDVRFVLPSPNGGVYVWDQSAISLREYDESGHFAREIGGRGDGPGEYRSANGIVRLKDGRLVLWDPKNLRMTVYGSNGRSIGQWRHLSTIGVDSWRGLLVDSSDAVYALGWFRAGDGLKEVSPSEREGYIVLDERGQVRDSVLRPPSLPRPSILVSRITSGAMIWDYVPFAAQPRWAISPLGYVVSGVGSRYAITLHRPNSPLRIERDISPTRVTSRERAAAEASIAADMRSVNRQWTWNGPAIPSVKSLFNDIRVSAEGRIWVERSLDSVIAGPDPATSLPAIVAPRGSGTELVRQNAEALETRSIFDVFSAAGYLLGTVQLPLGARVNYMSGDRVWGVYSDSLGRPTVVRWRVEPSFAAREREQEAGSRPDSARKMSRR